MRKKCMGEFTILSYEIWTKLYYTLSLSHSRFLFFLFYLDLLIPFTFIEVTLGISIHLYIDEPRSQYTKMPVHIFEYVNPFSPPERYAFDRKNNVGNSHEKRKHMIIWTDYCAPISLRNEAYFREREKTNQFH